MATQGISCPVRQRDVGMDEGIAIFNRNIAHELSDFKRLIYGMELVLVRLLVVKSKASPLHSTQGLDASQSNILFPANIGNLLQQVAAMT
jgi:hypothetical protein